MWSICIAIVLFLKIVCQVDSFFQVTGGVSRAYVQVSSSYLSTREIKTI